ncbi:MAG TPA: YggS family pyridoxal phosphate-dependent enzyme [Petrotoga sp.]|nr:MAG: Alanine racemase domain protein [Petrotoga mobilis]HBT50781.1 YggS family pyridoxal phosphate-dependent enzyme [Petrotoga sp.]
MNNFLIENYHTLINEIQQVTEKSGRDLNSIKLIAVTKNFPSEYIKTLYNEDHNDFGENRAQELREKYEELKNFDIVWHFIGRIQTNKIKYIVPIAEYIHSVWRMKEIEEIQKRAEEINKTQKVLLEINISGERSKAGLIPNQVDAFLQDAISFKNIKIIGLMTMAPYTDNANVIRNVFRSLRELRDNLNKKYPSIKELSMGMTNDYKIAIEEGATLLRIGTRIFGNRYL